MCPKMVSYFEKTIAVCKCWKLQKKDDNDKYVLTSNS